MEASSLPSAAEERIRRAVMISLYRGLGFCGLGVFTTMIGLSYDLRIALGAGAVLTGLVACALALKAVNAPRLDYRRTEAFLLLERNPGLRPTEAQKVFGRIRQREYSRCAGWGMALALFLSLPRLLL